MKLASLQGYNKNELSMIEVAHAILEERGEVMSFNDLLVAVQDYLELSDEQLERRMSVFYTEINIDGSFISLGDNRWGLRSWYAIDSIDEEIVSAFEEEIPVRRKKRKKLNAFITSEDDVDYSNDDPEDMDDIDDEDLDDDDLEDDVIDYDVDMDDLDDDNSAIEDELTIVSDEDAFDDL